MYLYSRRSTQKRDYDFPAPIDVKQARELCDRPQTSVFPKAAREDLSKLFLGKDAIAYITSRTPGPGTYDLGRKRPCFLSPSCEPGTSIGGPLANVDRVQTGPLGEAYKSFTPGPGAYDSNNDGEDRETKLSPPRLRKPGRYTSRRDFSVSVTSATRTDGTSTGGMGSMVSQSETDTTRGKVSVARLSVWEGIICVKRLSLERYVL